MATTNIDAVAEFKILTNAYQAEYGRAVGGQLQVVTKSGTQALPRLRLLVRTPLGLGRQQLFEQARDARGPEGEDLAQRLRLHDRRTGVVPRLQRARRRSCSSSGARNSSGAPTRRACTRRACRPRSSGAGDFSQSVDSSGNPFPYIRDSSTGLPCSAADTARLLRRTAASSDGFRRAAFTAPGSTSLEHLPGPNFSGRQRPQLHQPGCPTSRQAP